MTAIQQIPQLSVAEGTPTAALTFRQQTTLLNLDLLVRSAPAAAPYSTYESSALQSILDRNYVVIPNAEPSSILRLENLRTVDGIDAKLACPLLALYPLADANREHAPSLAVQTAQSLYLAPVWMVQALIGEGHIEGNLSRSQIETFKRAHPKDFLKIANERIPLHEVVDSARVPLEFARETAKPVQLALPKYL